MSNLIGPKSNMTNIRFIKMYLQDNTDYNDTEIENLTLKYISDFINKRLYSFTTYREQLSQFTSYTFLKNNLPVEYEKLCTSPYYSRSISSDEPVLTVGDGYKLAIEYCIRKRTQWISVRVNERGAAIVSVSKRRWVNESVFIDEVYFTTRAVFESCKNDSIKTLPSGFVFVNTQHIHQNICIDDTYEYAVNSYLATPKSYLDKPEFKEL